MSYFQGSTNKSNCKQPIVSFSNNDDRASLMSFSGPPTTRRKRSRNTPSNKRRSSKRGSGRRSHRTKTRVTKIRLVKGKVALRLKGFPGVQRLGASQLVRFVPLNKLKAAAKRALGNPRPQRQRRRRRHRQRHNIQ